MASCVDPFDWYPEQCQWSGLDKAPSGTREDYRGALSDIAYTYADRGLTPSPDAKAKGHSMAKSTKRIAFDADQPSALRLH